MAGDWIKVRHDLPADPAVFAIAAALNMREAEVVGTLLKFWIWGDQQTVDGNAVGVTESSLDRYIGVPGFAKAMSDVGWLELNGAGCSIPKFERHISQSAKKRALASKRVEEFRAKNRNAPSVTKALPEKRREEKKEEQEQFGLFAKDEPKPNGQVTPDKFDLFWSVVHLRKGKVPARKAYEKAVKRIKKESPGTDPDQHLRDRMKLFDSSPEAHPDPTEKRRPIHPATWLNDGRYDDDEDTWFEHGGPMEDEKLSYGINQPKRNARPPAPPGPER